VASKASERLSEAVHDGAPTENAAIFDRLREARPGAEAVHSPARQLQIQLEETWAAEAPARWSPRRSAAFIIGANLLLWGALVAAIRMMA